MTEMNHSINDSLDYRTILMQILNSDLYRYEEATDSYVQLRISQLQNKKIVLLFKEGEDLELSYAKRYFKSHKLEIISANKLYVDSLGGIFSIEDYDKLYLLKQKNEVAFFNVSPLYYKGRRQRIKKTPEVYSL